MAELDNDEGTENVPEINVVSYSKIQDYLSNLLPSLLEEPPQVVMNFLLANTAAAGVLKQFARDNAIQVVYISKSSFSQQNPDGDVENPGGGSLNVHLDLSDCADQVIWIALMKRVPVLDDSRSLSSQLQLFSFPLLNVSGTFGKAAVVETLHSLVHNAVSPFYDTFLGRDNGDMKASDYREEKNNKFITKRRIAELELSLVHLQQNVEIPNIELVINPLIQKVIDKAGGKRVVIDDLGDIVSDLTFLNRLQADVNNWIKEVQKVTRLVRDSECSSASQEINFWHTMEIELEKISKKLGAPGVTMTLDILKNAKRYMATVSFFADTGVAEALDMVQKYNIIMKDFPLSDIISASSIPKLREGVQMIFAHLNKKMKLSPYPIKRALDLVDSVSRDFSDQLLGLLSNMKLMYMDFSTFERLMIECDELFQEWDESVRDFVNTTRELSRKRSEKFIPIKVTSFHVKLQDHLKYLSNFRKQHQQLRVTLGLVLSHSEIDGDFDPLAEIDDAFQLIRDVNVLDTSVSGTEIWSAAETSYNEKISLVEDFVIKVLREKLKSAKTSSEMFRVFSKFNALFIRLKVRSAVQEYQTQLIENVKKDIQKLHEQFKKQYHNSDAAKLSTMHDLSPVSGSIIWAKQLERQLNLYMKRVEDVLGKGWELYPDGQKLAVEGNAFKRKLDTQPIFQSWISSVSAQNYSLTGPLFIVVKNPNGSAFDIIVNYDNALIDLFKEVRSLQTLKFQIPHGIVIASKEAKRAFPYSVSLSESLTIYKNTLKKVLKYEEHIGILLAGYQDDIHNLIHNGMNLRWESFTHGLLGDAESESNVFVTEFSAAAVLFQSKSETLVDIYENIDASILRLKECNYTRDSFERLVAAIQKDVDKLNLDGYLNVDVFVDCVNKKLSDILLLRLGEGVNSWILAFKKTKSEEILENYDNAIDNQNKNSLSKPVISCVTHFLTVKNQQMVLEPSLSFSKSVLYNNLNDWISIVCDLSKVKASRYDTNVHISNIETFGDLMHMIKSDSKAALYLEIENSFDEANTFVMNWLKYQKLWNLDLSTVFQTIGDQLQSWNTCLEELKTSRLAFEGSQTGTSFGRIEVDFAQIKVLVNQKFDYWQKEIMLKCSEILKDRMESFLSEVSKCRGFMENKSSLEVANSDEIIEFITLIEKTKKQKVLWEQMLAIFCTVQNNLTKLNFVFPKQWIYPEALNGEWSAFLSIFEKSVSGISLHIGPLRDKVTAETKLLEQKIEKTIAIWNEEKPIQGDRNVKSALVAIQTFENKLFNLKKEYDLISQAREALLVDIKTDDQLTPVIEEMISLKGVWNSLDKIWDSIEDLRETSWAAIVVRKLRQELDNILLIMKDMPSNMRQYAPYEFLQDAIKTCQKSCNMISSLKGDAIRERHWKSIFKKLKLENTLSLSQLTLGQVWDLNLKKNEDQLNEVISIAQGELVLEDYLRQVREFWHDYSVKLVVYQNKTRLIKGWDEIFEKCSEHANGLSSMRLSPHFRTFEDDVNSWDEKMSKIHSIFDCWIDVQRQWVYLEGIFNGNADIKYLLPNETNKFQSVNGEFLALMKKVSKSSLILDLIILQDLQQTLERLSEFLSKIQRALGEYLERERSKFSRFYFLGDEDLLEIIGNSKDISKIQKHLKKMFAGINQFMVSDSQIDGMISKDGETVRFSKSIVLNEQKRVYEWLLEVEREMKTTIAVNLEAAIQELKSVSNFKVNIDAALFMQWLDKHCAQTGYLAMQILWTARVEEAIKSNGLETKLLPLIEEYLDCLADAIEGNPAVIFRKKIEHLIGELVHEKNVIKSLIASGTDDVNDFRWLYFMRFYYDEKVSDLLSRLSIKVADASFEYGYEYIGVPDRLIQTPLTDKCYLTLTQALHYKFGGSPFGPAGTGKTETVKFLGTLLGRFVLVFCCDENFDFQAMGRIFLGLCVGGAWGCFDEFNRLEEKILSACSQQIQSIQEGLRKISVEQNFGNIEILSKNVKLQKSTALFVTMNPNYAGRSNLPENLKKLFRPIAMSKPDRKIIAEVMLFAQGFKYAETLASRIVPLFDFCHEQLSHQSHYDFGLRALKSVLVSSGNIRRTAVKLKIESCEDEQKILLQSISQTIKPKLVAEDADMFDELCYDMFSQHPKNVLAPANDLKKAIVSVCEETGLVPSENWIQKVIQIEEIQNIHHGLMLVGPPSAKTSARKVLLKAKEKLDGLESVEYVIDPKSVSKDTLYGHLDITTREWTDGLLTRIVRRIIDNVRGEASKRHWIVFDGDVDPEWVENLNSVLDDNRLLTLPNGERLSLPQNVRIVFEVENLKFATLATVSRCGMIWFSGDLVDTQMLFSKFFFSLRSTPLDIDYSDVDESGSNQEDSSLIILQKSCADVIEPYFVRNGLIEKVVEFVLSKDRQFNPIMELNAIACIDSLFALVNNSIMEIASYNYSHIDFPMSLSNIQSFMTKKLLSALIWSFAGSCNIDGRTLLSDYMRTLTSIELPSGSLIDYEVAVPEGIWQHFDQKVPKIDIETHMIDRSDIVIPTIDTVKHESILYSLLSSHKPVILSGPPGSGKSMQLFNSLKKLNDLEVITINFSSGTSSSLVLRTLEQHCEYRKTPSGIVFRPKTPGKWIVMFCDEINLPSPDKYGTQQVISFLRQISEHRGFYRESDKVWITVDRVQLVGACNPPTDPGRHLLPIRFLRHATVIMVNYPGTDALKQIYGTFSRAMLKLTPSLRAFSDSLTDAMVTVHAESQSKFSSDVQSHYIYSPRELSRWVRGIYEVLKQSENLKLEDLIRIWAHEALRLYQDRLVSSEEKRWTDEMIDRIALQCFPSSDAQKGLIRPILFSNWLSKNYVPVDRSILRDFVKARLKVFYEEELDVPLVLFDDVLDHVLRIDRVLRQKQGHVLLIGVSGSGKATLSRFVAWMNGFSVFQIQTHQKYGSSDFDNDLKVVLRRAGCKGEKICFILKESNLLQSGFLERMNTLLVSGEIPGLFVGDELSSLLGQCKESAAKMGEMLNDSEELLNWFAEQVRCNLHVIFTLMPSVKGLSERATTSPALFNRCVLDWFGDWSNSAIFNVGKELTHHLDLDNPRYTCPSSYEKSFSEAPSYPSHREALVNSFVWVHNYVHDVNALLSKKSGQYNYATPRHYLDFLAHYENCYTKKRSELEDEQVHMNLGLEKIAQTVDLVETLRNDLALKKIELEEKSLRANDRLEKMVKSQKDAEEQRAVSIDLQKSLELQQGEIDTRKQTVLGDLAEAEPAVLEAQKSVSGIKKQHLTEVRSMANPPNAVKLAMESVCTLLGCSFDSWKAVQQIIRKDDFIANIVNYDTEQMMTPLMRNKIKQEYLSNPDFNFENVNRASKACGPLVQWVIAQYSYSDILDRVGPLRQEVDDLEKNTDQNRIKLNAINDLVAELEVSIKTYKEEYAILIAEVERTKKEMELVKTKVDRSLALIDNLTSEQERWRESSDNFEKEMETIAGDVVLVSAFLAYSGFFDQQFRSVLLNGWKQNLKKTGIKFKENLSLVDFLSTAEEQLKWSEQTLPADEICMENATMLFSFNRFPLIMDPSEQAKVFIQEHFKSQKVVVTSFADTSFAKNLETALRFGTILIVLDAERFDPIINSVLNKEFKKNGGRTLIQLGSNEIDFSPTFKLFMVTSDPTSEFSQDVCSKVTFVNFTVTHESLSLQCLSQILRAERPEIDKKRADLIKLQGEYRARLRALEKSLLEALSSTKGAILEDESVLATLEALKKEASDVAIKSDEADLVMNEVESIIEDYRSLAECCSSLYFSLQNLSQINNIYQFSLDFFLEKFGCVLEANGSSEQKQSLDLHGRLDGVTRRLFEDIYKVSSRSLLIIDRQIYALFLCGLYYSFKGKHVMNTLIECLCQSTVTAGHHEGEEYLRLQKSEFYKTFLKSESQKRSLYVMINSGVVDKDLTEILEIQKWTKWILSGNLNDMPKFWSNSIDEETQLLSKLIMSKILKPDVFMKSINIFVEKIFGPHFMSTEVDFKKLVSEESSCRRPVVLCSTVGLDVSEKIENLASNLHKKLVSVAMGSSEGFDLAEKHVESCAITGSWVLLKNTHLTNNWLGIFAKRLKTLKPHPDFRIFMTTEISSDIPLNLLRNSTTLVFESNVGIKDMICTSLKSVERVVKPVEKSRLYVLVSWLHAIIIERLRYCPVGWTEKYDFNEADRECALKTLDSWLDLSAKSRTNIPLEAIPWEAIKTILKQSVYGGRIDNPYDQLVLNSFVDRLIVPAAYNAGFRINDLLACSTLPEGTNIETFINWAEELPSAVQNPVMIGLSEDSDEVLAFQLEKTISTRLLKLRALADHSSSVISDGNAISKDKDVVQNQFILNLVNKIEDSLVDIPVISASTTITGPESSILYALTREYLKAISLKKKISEDLSMIKLVCEGRQKHSNLSMTLFGDFKQNTIPLPWKRFFKVPKESTLLEWSYQLKNRLEHIKTLFKITNVEKLAVNLGLLFNPAAFITAMKQYTARKTGVTLDNIKLLLKKEIESDKLRICGLSIQGSTLTTEGGVVVGRSRTRSLDGYVIVCDHKTDAKEVTATLPVYLNEDRDELLVSIPFTGATGVSVYLAGAAIFANV